MSNTRLSLNLCFAFLILLSACTLPAPNNPLQGETKPGFPVFEQYVLDCRTKDNADAGDPIQPEIGCDAWNINRYERPFNADAQDEYYPDLDLLYADLGRSGLWYYVSIAVEEPEEDALAGAYGIEIDLDMDSRGDVLVAVQAPAQLDNPQEWSKAGVVVFKDLNSDVGAARARQPDAPADSDGYEDLIFNQGVGDDRDLAWARAYYGDPTTVEIAFKIDLLEGSGQFYWSAWADEGVVDQALFDYHDRITRENAGDVYQGLDFFPANEIFAVDNTCVQVWGVEPDGDDPALCIFDPHFPPFEPPDDDQCPPAMDFETWKD
jgi:hypothetical protein